MVFLLIAAISFYFLGYVRFNYPDRGEFPIWGIDVSHHQGKIDWQLLTSENVAFAYIKATECGDFKDPLFRLNWREASRANVDRGAYHFFTFCKSGEEQAANFIQSVPVEADALPPAIDFDFVGNCSGRPPKSALLQEVRAFVEKIELAYGQSPVFYVTYDSYKRYLDGAIPGYRLWVRDIFGYPSLQPERDFTFWQYADRARLKGIKGPVDLNVFNGNAEQFIDLLKKNG
jgi:lysozyme